MTAMEIYREDRLNRRNPEARLPRQEYFSLLRDTLHNELMRDGRSDFLDEMLAECSGGKALPMLEFAALRECYEMIVENQPMQDAREFVPHIYRTETERFAWRELGQSAYRVDNPEFPQLLARLRSVSHQLVAMRDDTLTPDANRAAQREIEGLMTLNRTLESDNAQLRREREELRAKIAALENGYVSQQLQQRLEVQRRQAESDIAQEMAQRREEAEARLRREIDDAAARQHRESAAVMRTAQEQSAARAASYQQLQDAMHAQLATMQEQLDSQLTSWQTRLYGADHRFLARSCASLMAAVHRETAHLLAEMHHRGAEDALLTATADLQAVLDTHLAQLEQALGQMDMHLFWPEEGEAFDSLRHSPVSACREEEAARAVIDRVEAPGVTLGSGPQTGETLVRAVVHIRQRGEG